MKKTTIITGSNRGIGKALVTQFAKAGYDIWACARTKNLEFEAYIKRLSEQENVAITPVYFDLTDSDEMKRQVKMILTEAKSIDVLVNCAGIAHGGFFQMTSVETIKKVFDVNFFSMLELTQLVLRRMVRNKSGSIINLASISGLDSRAGNCAYGTSKAAVIAWTKTLASEVGGLGIRVNAIAPGLTDTNMAKQMESRAGAEMVENSVMNRLVLPEEIANIAVFLASDNASIINGQVIRADGGSKK